MGQAKIKRESLRRKLIDKGNDWDFAPSPWEAAVCTDLKANEDNVVLVRRVSQEQLALLGMPRNECHANARWYAENSPAGYARMVTGWWVQWPNFFLHSVVEIDRKLLCITPSVMNETEFPFIVDSKIIWVENGNYYFATRDGNVIGPGVRIFPDFTMAQNAIVRQRMRAGMDPFRACEFSDEEMAKLKEMYIKE